MSKGEDMTAVKESLTVRSKKEPERPKVKKVVNQWATEAQMEGGKVLDKVVAQYLDNLKVVVEMANAKFRDDLRQALLAMDEDDRDAATNCIDTRWLGTAALPKHLPAYYDVQMAIEDAFGVEE